MKKEYQNVLGVVGVVLILVTIFSMIYNYNKAKAAQERSKVLSDQIQESFQKEFKLQEQLRSAQQKEK